VFRVIKLKRRVSDNTYFYNPLLPPRPQTSDFRRVQWLCRYRNFRYCINIEMLGRYFFGKGNDLCSVGMLLVRNEPHVTLGDIVGSKPGYYSKNRQRAIFVDRFPNNVLMSLSSH